MVVPQNIKHRIIIWFSNSTSGIGFIPKRIENKDSNRYLYTKVHGSIIHNNQKVERTQMSIKWINRKTWYTHTMEYHPALKGKEILTHAATWMKLKDIMLSEVRSQSQKDRYYMISFL